MAAPRTLSDSYLAKTNSASIFRPSTETHSLEIARVARETNIAPIVNCVSCEKRQFRIFTTVVCRLEVTMATFKFRIQRSAAAARVYLLNPRLNSPILVARSAIAHAP